MKYFFVLGVNPALSLAELQAVLNLKNPNLIGADFLIAEIDGEIIPQNLITKLGGTIKIGLIKSEIEATNRNEGLLSSVSKLALEKKRVCSEGKFNFGFSDYGNYYFNKKDLGIKLKKYFTEKEISSRFVVSQEKTLSSVVVAQNKLLSRGIEIVLAEKNKLLIIGETLAVQPFKDLSRRDFGRPARDDQSGMLPPKLAQIMINLAQIKSAQDLIIDPFCGSGTILSEAILMEHKNIFGSDISLKAIDDTKKNISWTKELYNKKDIKMKFLVKNVLDLAKVLKTESVHAIITEPYLGPQRGHFDFAIIIRELEHLYSGALKEFREILKSGNRVVMVWPLFYGNKPINPDITGFKIKNFLPNSLLSNEFIKKHCSSRQTIIYGRPGQKVFREIVVLEKE